MSDLHGERCTVFFEPFDAVLSNIGRLFDQQVELEGCKNGHHSALNVVVDFLYFQLPLRPSWFGGSQCFDLHL